MEEWVGQVWHKYITQKAFPYHEQAAVHFTECSRQLGLFYRAFSDQPGLQLKNSAGHRWQGKRSWLSKLARSEEWIHLAYRDKEAIYLPPQIGWFDNRALNLFCYRWLVALLSQQPPIAANDQWLPYHRKLVLDTLSRLPGLRKDYQQLATAYVQLRQKMAPLLDDANEDALRQLLLSPESKLDSSFSYQDVMPVLIWPDPEPPKPVATRAGETAGNDSHTPMLQETRKKKLSLYKKGQRVNEVDEKSGLMAFRLESVFSWAEFIPVDRTADEDDIDDAASAAENIDEIAVARNGEQQSGRLKFDLDLPAEDFDDIKQKDGILLPEWDYRSQSLMHDRCRLTELVPRQEEKVDLPVSLKARARKLRSQFEYLALQKQWLRAQPDGTEIDLDRVILQTADQKQGHAEADTKLYLDLRQNNRSLSCLLLADLSLSTDSFVGGQTRVIDIIKDSLYLFSEALSATHDRYAIAGFNSKKNDNVRYYKIKDFDESSSQQVGHRIYSLKPNFYTRMGAAIRHASKQLASEKSETRLLLLLTDGKPNDVDLYEGRYGIEDTRQAIMEARKKGIRIFCVTVDDEDSDYLNYLFGSTHYVRLTRAVELPEKLPLLYHHLTFH